jgi:hypothetical protein
MRNTINERIKHFSWSHPAFTVVEVLLLLVLTLCLLGQWSLLFMLIGLVIFISINGLIFSMLYQTYRNASSDDYHHPFSCMLYSMLDPLPSRSEQELIERREEEFKPFVFKDHPEDSAHE